MNPKLTKLSFALSLVAALGVSSSLPAQAGEFRTLNGSDNNLNDPELGETFTPLIRIFDGGANAYDDGISVPRGGAFIGGLNGPLPNPRAISNIVGVQPENAERNFLGVSAWLWQWGQAIDHDLDLNEANGEVDPNPGSEFQPIPTPADDPIFGGDPLPFTRVSPALTGAPSDPTSGTELSPRQHLNQLTHYIDASFVYGSEDFRAETLRSFNGGRLLTFDEQNPGVNTTGEILLPLNDFDFGSLPNADDGTGLDQTTQYVGGDVRVNEQVGLTAIHTLFLREHNRQAAEIAERLENGDAEIVDKFDEFATDNPDLSGDELEDEYLYHTARKVVGAHVQQITYNEFLPLLLGPGGLSNTQAGAYGGYDDTVDPSVSEEFANSAYRLGHTFLNEGHILVDDSGAVVESLNLADAFFNPDFVAENGVDELLVGLIYQQAEAFDRAIVDGVRDFLFPGGTGGLDLYSINIARGRDVGLPGYVDFFNDFVTDATGLGPINSQADLPFSPEVLALIIEAYDADGSGDLDADELDAIDIFVGGVAEGTQDGFNGGLVGPTVSAIIADQFGRTRDGDRFFYLNDLEHLEILDPDLLETTFTDILRRNVAANLSPLIPEDAFQAATIPEPATVISLVGLGALGAASRKRRKSQNA
jgi:hypothetical protein